MPLHISHPILVREILPLPVTLKVRSTSHLMCLFEKCTLSIKSVALLPVKVCCFFTPNHPLLTSKTWSNSDAFFRSDSIPWKTNISQLDKKTKQIWGGKALILRGQIHISHQNIRRMALIHLSEQGMAAWMNICTQTWSREVEKTSGPQSKPTSCALPGRWLEPGGRWWGDHPGICELGAASLLCKWHGLCEMFHQSKNSRHI